MSEPEIKSRNGVEDPGMKEAGREEGQGDPQGDGKRRAQTHCAEAPGGMWPRLPSWKDYA